MSHFRRDLLDQIDVRSFYEAKGFKLSRPSRSWCRTSCPFHESRSRTSFSIHLATGGFYCFSCGAKGGDILDYLRLRDNCSFKVACVLAGCWDEKPSPDLERELEHSRKEKVRLRAVAEDLRQQQHTLRLGARDEVHLYQRIFQNTSAYLTTLGMGNTTAESEACWNVLSLALPELRSESATYQLLSFGSADAKARFTLNESSRGEMVCSTMNDGLVRDSDGHVQEIDLP